MLQEPHTFGTQPTFVGMSLYRGKLLLLPLPPGRPRRPLSIPPHSDPRLHVAPPPQPARAPTDPPRSRVAGLATLPEVKKTTRRFVNVSGTALTYLLFDGAAAAESASLSLHMFHLLQFCLDDMDSVRAVHTYSSADGAWPTGRARGSTAGGGTGAAAWR